MRWRPEGEADTEDMAEKEGAAAKVPEAAAPARGEGHCWPSARAESSEMVAKADTGGAAREEAPSTENFWKLVNAEVVVAVAAGAGAIMAVVVKVLARFSCIYQKNYTLHLTLHLTLYLALYLALYIALYLD